MARRLVLVCLLAFTAPRAGASSRPAYRHLDAVMERYHKSFDVFTDLSAAGNHFAARCLMFGGGGRVTDVAFDESWFVDGTVSHADRTQVIFCGIRKTDMPQRSVALYEDETYKVDWAGTGYGVFRKSDGVMMGNVTFSLPEQAKAHLLSFYPKRVAA